MQPVYRFRGLKMFQEATFNVEDPQSGIVQSRLGCYQMGWLL